MTNSLILALLISTNATFHWERSPDPTVTGYVMYASQVSRFTKERRPIQFTIPTLPGQPTNTLVLMRNVTVSTNECWRMDATAYPLSNVTNWTMTPDTSRNYYAVSAKDAAGVESDLSNEVLFEPRWAYVDFCVEGSADLQNWTVLGMTNVLRFWAGSLPSGNISAFFRSRMVITNENK